MPDRFANGDPTNHDPPFSRGMHDRTRPRYYHGGDFRGIVEHLPYLKDLGVTAIWLTPIYDNVNHLNEREKYADQAITDYHGYGAIDFYGVGEHFGSLDEFRELVTRPRARHQGDSGPGGESHGPVSPQGQGSAGAFVVPRHPNQHLSNTWRTWTLIDPHAAAAAKWSTLDGWFSGILPDLNQDDRGRALSDAEHTLGIGPTASMDPPGHGTICAARLLARLNSSHPRALRQFQDRGRSLRQRPALTSFFQGGRARFDESTAGSITFSIFRCRMQSRGFSRARPRCESYQRRWHTTPSTPMRRAWSRLSACMRCHASCTGRARRRQA